MNLEEEVAEWLSKRPVWQQEAVDRLLKKRKLEPSDYEELADLCIQGDHEGIVNTRDFSSLTNVARGSATLMLLSLSEIEGIDNLGPRNPLQFRSSNLSVIYGGNGSGKSGYVRIIKKAAGKPGAKPLRSNVFKPEPESQRCTFSLRYNGEDKTIIWNCSDSPVRELALLDIFDLDLDQFYLNNENHVAYAPRLLNIFDHLVRVCKRVREVIEKRQQQLPSKLPSLPPKFQNTQAGKLYSTLNGNLTQESLRLILSWGEDDSSKLTQIETRLSTNDQKKVAEAKRRQSQNLENLIANAKNALSKLTETACEALRSARANVEKKQRIVREAADNVLKNTLVDGVGDETWKALWNAARRFSEAQAYPAQQFPYTDEGSYCLLCHQPINDVVGERLKSFEEFIKGELEQDLTKAKRYYETLLKELPIAPADDVLVASCEAAGVLEEKIRQEINAFWSSIGTEILELQKPDYNRQEGLCLETHGWISALEDAVGKLIEEAKQLDEDTKSFNRDKVENEALELAAKKWTSEQSKAIQSEIERLQQVQLLDNAMAKTRHTDISTKAGKISEAAITEAYIDRFNEELKALGASKIKVELVRTRTAQGKALHALRLAGIDSKLHRPIDILSEGEKRIVALASFLADMRGRNVKSTFIFDDPISSLDQEFEEKTLDRLISLSADRQVIVFTHRLSLVSLLDSKVDDLHLICIEHEHWGAGEPSRVSIKGKKPTKILNVLRDEFLAKAKKCYREEGKEGYVRLGLSICVDIRKTLERIIELVLLADVVQRHRRGIETKNKLEKLARIKPSDCKLLDDLMTKYSVYLHSHSLDAPVEILEPDEIDSDIDLLLKWLNEFSKRETPLI